MQCYAVDDDSNRCPNLTIGTSQHCLKHQQMCHNRYKKYKKSCDKESANINIPCEAGDLSNMTLEELDEMITHLTHRLASLRKCYDRRLYHHGECIHLSVSDPGHEKQLELLESAMAQCEDELKRVYFRRAELIREQEEMERNIPSPSPPSSPSPSLSSSPMLPRRQVSTRESEEDEDAFLERYRRQDTEPTYREVLINDILAIATEHLGNLQEPIAIIRFVSSLYLADLLKNKDYLGNELGNLHELFTEGLPYDLNRLLNAMSDDELEVILAKMQSRAKTFFVAETYDDFMNHADNSEILLGSEPPGLSEAYRDEIVKRHANKDREAKAKLIRLIDNAGSKIVDRSKRGHNRPFAKILFYLTAYLISYSRADVFSKDLEMHHTNNDALMRCYSAAELNILFRALIDPDIWQTYVSIPESDRA